MTLHEAMREVLAKSDTPIPARAVANEINRRRLYARGDGRSLDYQQVLARARRYPDLFEVNRRRRSPEVATELPQPPGVP